MKGVRKLQSFKNSPLDVQNYAPECNQEAVSTIQAKNLSITDHPKLAFLLNKYDF